MKRTITAVAVAILTGLGLSYLLLGPTRPGHAGPKPEAKFDPAQPPRNDKFGEGRAAEASAMLIPFDDKRAMKYLQQLCDLGPRVSATDGMAKQQELLVKHFEAHGATVRRQEFDAKQRSRKQSVKMTNLIISWFPDRTRRVILCSHYDTRPMAHEEQNRNDWMKPFISANDGTSGVAMFMELAHHMKTITTGVGVDMVLFDGEEYIFEINGAFGERDKFFLGSEYFAEDYAKTRRTLKYSYEAAILYDLFAHPGAKYPVEEYSWQRADKLVSQFWGVAKQMNAKSFQFVPGPAIEDDHLALNRVGIPAVDVIDYEGYHPHWHKLTDTPDRCSGSQMAEVANVTIGWLQTLK
jgi:glutaminyl-peptide cyclotransferase